MSSLNPRKFSVKNWYKNQLNKSQKIFLFVFFTNIVGFLLVLHGIFAALYNGKDAFVVIGKFTNQSNVLLLIFSTIYIFFPKHSFLKNDKFLIACITYIFFTFFIYNTISAVNAIGAVVSPNSDLAASQKKIGYALSKKGFRLFVDLYKHLFNPVIFIICGFIKYIYDPNIRLQKYHQYLIPISIYPIIYSIYTSTIPFVYKTKDGTTYTVYDIATNTKDYPQVAYPVVAFLILIWLPLTCYLVWLGVNKISNKYKQNYVDKQN
ncbi:DUF1600 domain-containing protein [Mycoplasma sp. T363T]|uniref:DUF1600 domain-containing protein n=1 Tax=Mycoplasma bradburyae TaxID=2963128 RepID=UPI002341E90B|nr:DUF1600 domain-containing protein [Mycoplasma bradburyae]MDC4163020.1 DUF1600 domain-containing protein [Mycoplasma bradburyae]